MITPRDLQSDILRRFPSTDMRNNMTEPQFQTLLNKLVGPLFSVQTPFTKEFRFDLVPCNSQILALVFIVLNYGNACFTFKN